MCSRALILLAALGVAGAAPGQDTIEVGEPAARLEPDKVFNASRHFRNGLRGKLVLHFWYLPEVRSSLSVARRLDGIYRKHRRRGFSVVGITHRPEEAVASFARRARVSYPLIVESSNISMGSYPFHSWPSAALVDPRGRVVWKGVPSQVSDGLVKKHIRGARAEGPDAPLELLLEVPPPLEKAARAARVGRLGVALKIAGRVGKRARETALKDAAWELRQTVGGFLDQRLREAAKEEEDEEYHRAELMYERVIRHAKGTDQAERADERLDAMRKDRRIRRELEGGRVLYDARLSIENLERDRALDLLGGLVTSKWDGTACQKKARQLLEELR